MEKPWNFPRTSGWGPIHLLYEPTKWLAGQV
jgi:hypothetical protein